MELGVMFNFINTMLYYYLYLKRTIQLPKCDIIALFFQLIYYYLAIFGIIDSLTIYIYYLCFIQSSFEWVYTKIMIY